MERLIKKFDLEERTYAFAEKVKFYIIGLPKSMTNIEYGKQLARSSGSVAANYIEANESFSKKDFLMRVKICRKEIKESRMWLRLTDSNNTETNRVLVQEATELMKIFGSIIEKVG